MHLVDGQTAIQALKGQGMNIITTTDQLARACDALLQAEHVAVDTEFMRETVYWPALCLIQAAGGDTEIIIDPLAEGIDLEPFWELMVDERVMKVFHAARQDLEIFYNLGDGLIPTPMFDSQVAAMAIGLGDSIAYDNLVQTLLKRPVDKGSRFTDWSRRPLSDNQLTYAIGDVNAFARHVSDHARASGKEEPHILACRRNGDPDKSENYRMDPKDRGNAEMGKTSPNGAAWRGALAQARQPGMPAGGEDKGQNASGREKKAVGRPGKPARVSQTRTRFRKAPVPEDT